MYPGTHSHYSHVSSHHSPGHHSGYNPSHMHMSPTHSHSPARFGYGSHHDSHHGSHHGGGSHYGYGSYHGGGSHYDSHCGSPVNHCGPPSHCPPSHCSSDDHCPPAWQPPPPRAVPVYRPQHQALDIHNCGLYPVHRRQGKPSASFKSKSRRIAYHAAPKKGAETAGCLYGTTHTPGHDYGSIAWNARQSRKTPSAAFKSRSSRIARNPKSETADCAVNIYQNPTHDPLSFSSRLNQLAKN